jgi:hypothetical protein
MVNTTKMITSIRHAVDKLLINSVVLEDLYAAISIITNVVIQLHISIRIVFFIYSTSVINYYIIVDKVVKH